MEPRIQYATTSDGVSIAYASEGQGTPLVLMPNTPLSTLIWWSAFGEEMWQPFSRTNRLIFYDSRGSGYSDRSADDFSIDAMIHDLESVAEAERLDQYVVVAFNEGVPVAVTYAARYPDRVTHLILCDGYVSASDYREAPAWEMQKRLAGADWKLVTEAFAQVLWGGPRDSALAKMAAELFRESCSQEVFWKSQRDFESRDISSELVDVRCPTLVIHNRNNALNPLNGGQRLAAGIPGARLSIIDDLTYATVPGMVAQFLGGPTAATTRGRTEISSGTAAQTGLTVILFADIADSTALTERLGDIPFRARARDLDGALRTVITDLGGTPIEGKLLGDGILAVFTSAREGIAAALMCGMAGAQQGLPLHLGLHAGDVIREDSNVYGGAVNIAARISGLSAPGEVLVSETVRSLARTSAGVRFEDRGEQELKGVGEAVRVWAVVQGEAS